MPRSHKPRKRYVPKRMDANPVELVISGISLLMPHQVDELTAVLDGLTAGGFSADIAEAVPAPPARSGAAPGPRRIQ